MGKSLVDKQTKEVDWEEEMKRLKETKTEKTSQNYIRETLLDAMRKIK